MTVGRAATAPATGRPEPRPVLPDWAAGAGGRPGLERQLDALERAIEAARVLGIPTEPAERVRDEAIGRLGFPADIYVLALIGGTGVGKSSLLNALAGGPISPASVRRPTTDHPVAWIPQGSREEVASLLDWLGIDKAIESEPAAFDRIAIVDLPDMDSVDPDHRERVEAILPKIDAVAWVVDPEKYHDAALHDEFLRTWVPRLWTQAIILNKVDRLAPTETETIRRDLDRDLGRTVGAGRARVAVVSTSAAPGREELTELRDWLGREIEAKRIVRARLATGILAALQELAAAAGADAEAAAEPILDIGERRRAIESVAAHALRAIDLAGLERQAIAATQARARARGTGPIGLVTSTIYRLSGREARVADPGGYLVRWRERGPLGQAVEALRSVLVERVRTAPPAIRPVLAANVEPGRLRDGLAQAIDRAVAHADRTVPASRWWAVFGTLQTLATVAIALSVAWIVLWVVARPPVDSLDLPAVGAVPMPFAALVVALAAGYLIARLLGLHARWLGRRWAARLRREVSEAVERQVREDALAPLDRLESARRALWAAAREAAAVRMR